MTEEAGGESEPNRPSESGLDTVRVVRYLQWGGLVALGLLAVIAGIGLYSSLSSIIDVWIADRYQPFARAGMNVAVLCVAGAGIAVLLRRV